MTPRLSPSRNKKVNTVPAPLGRKRRCSMKGMMKIMLTFPTVAALLAAVTTRSCRAFVMQQPIHHCCAASRTTGMMRSSSSLMKRSTCHQNRETTNKMSDMSVSNRNKDKTSNNAMTMETVRACRARLAALGRVSKLNPNRHTATISKAAGETAYAFPVIGSSDQRRRRAAPRMAPRAVLKRGEKSGAGSIKMGLSRARRALHQVLGRGSSVAQVGVYRFGFAPYFEFQSTAAKHCPFTEVFSFFAECPVTDDTY